MSDPLEHTDIVGVTSNSRNRRIRWRAGPECVASGMSIAIALMQHEVMQAVRAAATGDVAEMMSAHEALAAYSDDD